MNYIIFFVSHYISCITLYFLYFLYYIIFLVFLVLHYISCIRSVIIMWSNYYASNLLYIEIFFMFCYHFSLFSQLLTHVSSYRDSSVNYYYISIIIHLLVLRSLIGTETAPVAIIFHVLHYISCISSATLYFLYYKCHNNVIKLPCI